MSEKINKYTYEIVLQGNYGYGWDDETYCDDYKDAKEQLKTYRENVRNASFRALTLKSLYDFKFAGCL